MKIRAEGKVKGRVRGRKMIRKRARVRLKMIKKEKKEANQDHRVVMRKRRGEDQNLQKKGKRYKLRIQSQSQKQNLKARIF